MSYFWEGEKIRLRELRETDVATWLDEDKDSESQRTLNPGIELPKTATDAADFLERFGDFSQKDGRIMFSVETLDGQLVGGLNINSIDNRNGTFSIGSLIHRRHRGKGYFLEAKRIVLRYCFHELRLQKYNAGCIEFNEDMIRHFQRLGCQPEGRRRRVAFTNGRYYADLLYGLTREEFDVYEASL